MPLPNRWILLALLVSSILVNYIDRGALSVAVPQMEQDFSLTASQKGWILSAFFWSYALMQLPAGWLVDRYNVKWVYAGGYLVWTIATALTGWVIGFGSLVAARLLLGLGESAAYPAISRLVAENYPESERGLVNSLIDSGSKLGPALSILVGGLVIDSVGWRPLFITLGLGGIVWLVPWLLYIPSRPTVSLTETDQDQPDRSRSHSPTTAEILMHRAVWGTSLGMFSLGYVWVFLLTWLPSYMMDVHHFDLKQTAVLAALPFLAMAIATTITGWASDRMIARGRSTTLVRKGVALSGLVVSAVLIVLASLVASGIDCVMLLIATCCALGMFTANVWAMTQTMAGPAAGRWTGVQNCIGNMGGVASPLVAGWSIEQTGSYQTAFYVAAAVMLAGAACYLALVPKIEPVRWANPLVQETQPT